MTDCISLYKYFLLITVPALSASWEDFPNHFLAGTMSIAIDVW